MSPRIWRRFAALILASCSSLAAQAQDFPSRPLRIIVNTAPGGLVDVSTRLIAQQMGEILKQSVVVENRAGGDGLIGIRAVKTAPADGYTLLASAGTVAFQMAVRQDPGYDVTKDFTAIGMLGRSPFLFVVEPGQPDKSMRDFMGRAKAAPGTLSYASAGVGTATHFAAEVFLQQTGIKLMHVPYKGNGAAMPDVLSGRVNGIFEAYASSSAKIRGGQLRALGVTSAARLPGLPDVPTFIEQGVPNYTYYTWMCLIAPAGTPRDVVARLSQALRAAVASRPIKDRFNAEGVEVMDMTPDEAQGYIGREAGLASRLVSDLGLPRQ